MYLLCCHSVLSTSYLVVESTKCGKAPNIVELTAAKHIVKLTALLKCNITFFHVGLGAGRA